jgi:hypothetical protein
MLKPSPVPEDAQFLELIDDRFQADRTFRDGVAVADGTARDGQRAAERLRVAAGTDQAVQDDVNGPPVLVTIEDQLPRPALLGDLPDAPERRPGGQLTRLFASR